MTIENVFKVIFQAIVLALLIWRVSEYTRLYGRERREQNRRMKEQGAKAQKRKTSKKKKKEFEGLTRQPVCEQCVAESQKVEEVREPPPRIERTKGRPQEVYTAVRFCPHEGCAYKGWLDRGNIVSNGHPNGGVWRQLKCVVCGTYFQETMGTIFYRSKVPVETIVMGLTLLSEGVSPRKKWRGFSKSTRIYPQFDGTLPRVNLPGRDASGVSPRLLLASLFSPL